MLLIKTEKKRKKEKRIEKENKNKQKGLKKLYICFGVFIILD